MEYRFGWMTESVERELFAIAGEGHARWTFEVRREIGKHGKCVRGTMFISDEGIRRIEDARRAKLAALRAEGASVERMLEQFMSGLDLTLEPAARDYAEQRENVVLGGKLSTPIELKNVRLSRPTLGDCPEAIVAKPKNSAGRVLAGAKVLAREAFGVPYESLCSNHQNIVQSRVSKILDATDGPTKELAGKIRVLETENARLENELAKRAGHAGILRAVKALNEALALARTKVSPDHPVQKEINAILEGLGA